MAAFVAHTEFRVICGERRMMHWLIDVFRPMLNTIASLDTHFLTTRHVVLIVREMPLTLHLFAGVQREASRPRDDVTTCSSGYGVTFSIAILSPRRTHRESIELAARLQAKDQDEIARICSMHLLVPSVCSLVPDVSCRQCLVASNCSSSDSTVTHQPLVMLTLPRRPWPRGVRTQLRRLAVQGSWRSKTRLSYDFPL